ncbi:MAG: glycerophosphodiester phosphodiesterase family protein, partial [Candidatus Nanopelagicales bacterium]
SNATIRPLVDVLLRQKVLGRVCLASFNDARLRWLRLALGRQACTAAGPREIARARWASRRGRRIQLPGVDVLQIPLGPSQLPLLNDRFLQAAHDAELPVHVWTINQREVIERLVGLGVDGIMSDDAETLREVFVSRGIWRAGQP